MLNLNCVICTELFVQTDEVNVTVCGHMFHYVCLSQWLERSKTCPQCRNRCNTRNIIRLYFNLANLDTTNIDIGSLQEQLENTKLQLKIRDQELKKAEEEIKSLKDSQKMCKKTITGMEAEMKKKDFVLLSYMEQIKILKTNIKVTDDLRKEVKSLKQQLETVEGVSCILAASNAEAEKLLKTENDPKKLSIWVITLKRELKNCDNKKTDISNILRAVQRDYRREIDSRKKLEERIAQLESECYTLNEKLKTLEEPTPSTSKAAQHSISKSIEAKILREDKRPSLSPTIIESVRKIEESDSPYLNIKSSSVGLMPYAFKRNQEAGLANKDINTALTTTKLAFLKVSPNKLNTEIGSERKFSSDLTEKYSIFKKPRLGLLANTANGTSGGSVKTLPSNLVFNGFGGSERIDPFARNPSDDDVEMVNDTSATNRQKKPLVNLKHNESNVRSKIGLKKTNSSSGSNISDRLKSGGLRNFMISNRDAKIFESFNIEATSSRDSFPRLQKAHSTTGSSSSTKS